MKYIVANWKMNMDKQSIKEWIQAFKNSPELNNLHCEVVICPPNPYLYLTSEQDLSTGSQDVSAEDIGAHTGEVAASMIRNFASYCILGHSERKEARELVELKITKALDTGLKPVVCFIDKEDSVRIYKESIILAWEDPQNISVGGVYKAKDPAEIRENIKEIKSGLPQGAIVLYGGSVNDANAKDLAAIEDLDGVLVGNASLDPEHFKEIVKAFAWQ